MGAAGQSAWPRSRVCHAPVIGTNVHRLPSAANFLSRGFAQPRRVRMFKAFRLEAGHEDLDEARWIDDILFVHPGIGLLDERSAFAAAEELAVAAAGARGM